MTVSLNLILVAFLVGFFAGMGWSLAHWLLAKVLP